MSTLVLEIAPVAVEVTVTDDDLNVDLADGLSLDKGRIDPVDPHYGGLLDLSISWRQSDDDGGYNRGASI